MSSGYHHLDVHPSCQKFLEFSWDCNGVRKYYYFTVLPFGISSAAHIFTKVLRELVNYWRAKSFPVIVYLDDGWACDSYERCQFMSNQLLTTLLRAGFLPNYDKSIFVPTHILDWLGFTWKLKDGIHEVPSKKINKIHDSVNVVLLKKSVTARTLASLVCKIISLIPALGTVCQLMTRHCCMAICVREGWDVNFVLSDTVESELEFWSKTCPNLPFKLISPIERKPERIVFSDASSFAGAGFIELNGEHTIVHSMWKDEELDKSSTWREMQAIFYILHSLYEFLSKKLVKIYTDNQNVVRTCSVGSMKPDLQCLALQIYEFCVQHSITIELEWIPRNLNVQADIYSKMFDFDHWGVATHVF